MTSQLLVKLVNNTSKIGLLSYRHKRKASFRVSRNCRKLLVINREAISIIAVPTLKVIRCWAKEARTQMKKVL